MDAAIAHEQARYDVNVDVFEKLLGVSHTANTV